MTGSLNSGDQPFSLTLFTSFAAADKTEETYTLEGLAGRIRATTRGRKGDLPWLKLARFGDLRTDKNSLRHDANVLAITGIEADYDGEKMSVENAVEKLTKAGIHAMLYTSPSHTEDTPRWRVICPTSEPLSPGRRETLMGRLNGLFDGIFSSESWTLSQAYYFGSVNRNPSHQVHVIDGWPIDEHDDLDEIWAGKPDTIARPMVNGHHASGVLNEEALLEAITTGASYHAASVRLLGRWARQGVAYMVARQRILTAFETIPEAARDARWGVRYNDIDRCLEDIYGAEAQAKDQRQRPATLEEPPKWMDEVPASEEIGPSDGPNEWLVRSAPPDAAISVFDPWNTLRPVAFPLKSIPARVRGFVLSRAMTIGADPCALAWSVLSACSAAISGDIRLLMKRHDHWSVPPAIWVSLVGSPSTKKSPIIDAAWLPLLKAQGRDLRMHTSAMTDWKSIPKKEREEGDEPPQPRRLITHDATMEKLQEILSHQTRGIGVLRDELAGWIGSMEKYAPGKGGAADRAFWLQSYNGGQHVVDRVARGTVSIENLLVTVCGGIQPDRLRQFSDLTDDGLWQRFVPIIVAPGTLGTDEASDHTVDLYREVIEGLLSIPPGQRFHLSSDAHLIRETIEARLHALEQADVHGARFTGFIGKMMGLWGRLCLVMHLIDNAGEEVSELTAFNAHELLFRSVLPNAARVYTAMGGAGADIEATRSIAGYILTKGLRRIVISDLTSNVRVCRHKTVEDVRKLLSPLEAGGWLLPEKDFAPTAWLVNDAVHAFFAGQTERERERRTMARGLILGETTL